jgi:hypothetical protein
MMQAAVKGYFKILWKSVPRLEIAKGRETEAYRLEHVIS